MPQKAAPDGFSSRSRRVVERVAQATHEQADAIKSTAAMSLTFDVRTIGKQKPKIEYHSVAAAFYRR